jgi:hypothetical protein
MGSSDLRAEALALFRSLSSRSATDAIRHQSNVLFKVLILRHRWSRLRRSIRLVEASMTRIRIWRQIPKNTTLVSITHTGLGLSTKSTISSCARISCPAAARFGKSCSGFCNQTVDVRLFEAECLSPLRTIVQQLRPRALFDIPPRGISEHFLDAAMFRLRRTLNFRQQGFRK